MVEIAKKVEPLNSFIFVRDDIKEEKRGGLYIPDSASDEKMIQGEVLGVSDILLEDGRYIRPQIKDGMKVLYNNFAGTGNQWEEDKRTYRLIKFNEILAIVHK